MKNISDQLSDLIPECSLRLKQIPEEIFAGKPRPDKWSPKEILGHLVDSAQNNIRRFIVAQYEESPHIIYNQDKWVAISNYQNADTGDLIELWVLLNKHICAILKNTPVEMYERICKTNNGEPHTLKWLSEDYLRHLLHHMSQIIKL